MACLRCLTNVSVSGTSTRKPDVGICSSELVPLYLPIPQHGNSNLCGGNFFLSVKSKPHHSKLKISCSSGPHKLVRDRSLDRNVVKSSKTRFVLKLKTLLLSKPKHYLPLSVLYKCCSYLCLPKPRSILSMIRRYPTIFELFTIPTPPTPFNATKPLSQLCVRLTPAAETLAAKESDLKFELRVSLAEKLQKLLMIASHHRLLLSKLVHIAPDLGLPVDFRLQLCNEFPERFKLVDTSYGRALELVSWNMDLAYAIPSRKDDPKSLGLIVDRPLKFEQVRLRKGINVKRRHHDFLLKFEKMPQVCPYRNRVEDFQKETLEAEKRACAVVREVLGMTIEKWTLVDHLTHFRKEFGLPNKLRAMLVRHPELFYVSLKGQRDSVFLVEGYNDKGGLVQRDKMLVIRDQLVQLVREGKRMRRDNRKAYSDIDSLKLKDQLNVHQLDSMVADNHLNYEDDLDDLFEFDDLYSQDDIVDEAEEAWVHDNGVFWTTKSIFSHEHNDFGDSEPW